MIYQIIYSSESATPMQQDDLEEILEHAQSNNSRNNINGALVYADGVFLQILEGNKDSVDYLMAKISMDIRHEMVTVLRKTQITAAMFTDWKMAYVGATAEQIAKWAGLTETTRLPDVLDDIRRDSDCAAEITKNILSLLASKTASRIKPE